MLFYTSFLHPDNVICKKTRALFATLSVALWLPLMGVRLSVQGGVHRPQSLKTIQFYLSTHQSFTDALSMAVIFWIKHNDIGPGIALYKAELGKLPVIGQLNRFSGNVPVGRSGDLEAAKRSLEQAGKRGREGYHVSGFPEGARRRTPSTGGRDQIGKLKKGFFYLASQLSRENYNVELFPMVFVGSGRSWTNGNALPVRGSKVTVRLGDPLVVDPAMGVDELTMKFEDCLFDEIQSCGKTYNVDEAFSNGIELSLGRVFCFEIVVTTIPVIGVVLAGVFGLL